MKFRRNKRPSPHDLLYCCKGLEVGIELCVWLGLGLKRLRGKEKMKDERNRGCVWRGKKRRGEGEGGREGAPSILRRFTRPNAAVQKK